MEPIYEIRIEEQCSNSTTDINDDCEFCNVQHTLTRINQAGEKLKLSNHNIHFVATTLKPILPLSNNNYNKKKQSNVRKNIISD